MAQPGAEGLRGVGLCFPCSKPVHKGQQHRNRAGCQGSKGGMLKHAHGQHAYNDGLPARPAGQCGGGLSQAAQCPQKYQGHGLQKAHGQGIGQQVEVGQAVVTSKRYNNGQQAGKGRRPAPHL